MHHFLAAVAAALRAVAAVTRKMIWTGTRWILAPFRSTPAPAYTPIEIAPTSEPSDYTSLRRAAGMLAQGQPLPPNPQLDSRTRRWLTTLDRPMLCRLLAADDASIRQHLRGDSIRGVLTFDEEAVDDYRQSIERTRLRKHEAAPRRRRVLRDVLVERGIYVG